MIVQHTKWLEEAAKLAVARADRFAQRPAHLDLLAQRSQRLQPPGPGPDRRDALEARHGRAHLPAAGRQLPALGGRPLLPQPQLRQPDRDRQAAAAAVARRWTTAIEHCARGASVWAWASNDDGRRAGRRAGLRRRRADARDGGGGLVAARARAGAAGCASSTWWT